LEAHPTQQIAKSADAATDAVSEGTGAHVVIGTECVSADLPDSERRAGVRLVVSSRRRTVARYGEEGYRQLDTRLSELCEATARSTGDETIKLYVDDESCLREFGVEVVEACDPCEVTGLLKRIESRLHSESKKVESLLMVGGDKIIPFHRLANRRR
jgi:hypothetical protein